MDHKGRRRIGLALLIMALAVLMPGNVCRDKNHNISRVCAKSKNTKKKKKKKAPKLSAKKLTIYTGKTGVLRIKNAKKATWKVVYGKKRVKIVRRRKNRILLRGKKPGIAKIKVKAGKKKLICKVIVKKKKKKIRPVTPTGGKPEDPGPVVDQSKDPMLGNFGFDMLKILHKSGHSNVLISPDSILSALTMTSFGAAGETLKGMNTAMRTQSPKESAETLSALHKRLGASETAADSSGDQKEGLLKYKVANSIWTNRDLFTVKDSFIRQNKAYFGAEIYSEPFNDTTLNRINGWVSDQTDKMIPGILDRLTPSDRMIILNAICFEGEWMSPYDSSQVKDGTFTGRSGKKTVKMMRERARGKYYMEMAGGRGFVKYYRNPSGAAGRQFAFFAFLPPKGESMDAYLNKISGTVFRKAYVNRMNRIVISELPKFVSDYDADLKNPLSQMGMEDAFKSEADFSGISEQAVYIDDVIHKTHIEVDQEGTKAAAVTAVVAKASSVLTEEIKTEEIILDRPFVYGIMDTTTGQPLFAGTADEIGK